MQKRSLQRTSSKFSVKKSLFAIVTEAPYKLPYLVRGFKECEIQVLSTFVRTTAVQQCQFLQSATKPSQKFRKLRPRSRPVRTDKRHSLVNSKSMCCLKRVVMLKTTLPLSAPPLTDQRPPQHTPILGTVSCLRRCKNLTTIACILIHHENY